MKLIVKSLANFVLGSMLMVVAGSTLAADAKKAAPVDMHEGVSIEACEHLAKQERSRCMREQDRKFAEMLAASHRIEHGYLFPLTEALAKSGHARDLALAAALRSSLIASSGHTIDPRIDAWRRDALSAGGDDPLVALLVRYRPVATEADAIASQALLRWRASDPENLVPLLLSNAEDAAWWASTRETGRNVHYFAEVRQLLREMLVKHPPSDAVVKEARKAWPGGFEAFIQSVALQFVMAGVPSYAKLMSGCRPPARTSSPERAADCRRLGALMADHSDIVISEMIGLALLRKEDDPALRADAEQRTLIAKWQLQRWNTFGESAAADLSEFSRMHSNLGEGELIRAFLAARGEPMTPPANWSPNAVQSP